MLTLKDIAEKTGVTKVTVSYVLNGREKEKHISRETAGRIKETARKLGYRIDDFARAMSTGRAKVIGFLSANPNLEVMASVMKHAAQKDYMVKALYYDENTRPEEIVDIVLKQRLCGLVIYNICIDNLEKISMGLAEKNIPVATMFGGKVPECCTQVCPDDYAGGRIAARHLISLGHERIAYIENNPESPYAIKRKNGFADALSEKNIRLPSAFFHVRTEREKVEGFVSSMMSRRDRPTAFFCISDWLAIEILTILLGRGIRVPDDVSLVGYANLEAGRFCHPALTTIAENYSKIGEKLVARITGRLKSHSVLPEKAESVAVELIVRDSSGSVSKYRGAK